MMPLALSETGAKSTVLRIGGSPEIKRHLENLGFAVGGCVTVITQNDGNVIVNVKDTRIAISKEMANKIMI